jgi:cytochrome c oxidase subunit 2
LPAGGRADYACVWSAGGLAGGFVRKGVIIQLCVLGAVIGAVVAVIAFLIPWMPDDGAEQAGRIDDIYLLASVISVVIFAIVAAWLLYSVVKFRARPDDDEDGKPIHGHTRLEIFWTAIPTALVTVIAIWSGIVLTENEKLPAEHQVIQVKAQQFAWAFTYPDAGVTTGQLRVPVGETIELEMESDDVIHSFWVPEWRVKQDVVPGTVQRIVVTPTKEGTFPLICTELCGLGHSFMRASAIVLSRADYDTWVQEQKTGQSGGSAGQQAFVNAGCGACHALAAAGSTAQIGPDLDKVTPGLTAEGIRQAIVDPDAEIAPGYQAGVMPTNFGEQLSNEQLDQLVQYLQESTKG